MHSSIRPAEQEDILTFEPSFRLARKSKRWIATAIDFIIAGILGAIAAYCFGDATIDEDGFTSYDLSGAPGFFAMLVAWFLPMPLLEMVNNGQTLGKAIFKIRSANMDGSKINASSAIGRRLFDIIDYLPFFGIVGLLVASNNSRQQRVGDLIAKTIVIEA
ncbi:MAG: RDD family protein [Niastella sp.]|nr:RDD family protein [Niastella sp.]